MNRSLALLAVVVAGSAIWIASSRAEPASPPTPAQAVGPWEVIALAAATNDGGSHAIPLNGATGETWTFSTQSPSWQKLGR